MLNLKELVLKSYSSAPQIIRLVERGPKLVMATSFHSLPSDIEIVNPNQYIATLSEGATLEMELTIERGKGYRSVDRSKEDHSSPIDTLKIDAVFMPVRKVKYEIKDARIGDAINKESLLIDIWTNGSITPQEALSQAASVLVNLFSPLQEITLAPSLPQERDDQDETKQIHIEELQLSVRAYNCLKRAQINTVADLLEYTQDDLLEIKNFGQKSAEEVMDALKQHLGLTLTESKASKVS
jgi:DNA-directed RNA polymerase subunit alpha